MSQSFHLCTNVLNQRRKWMTRKTLIAEDDLVRRLYSIRCYRGTAPVTAMAQHGTVKAFDLAVDTDSPCDLRCV